MEHLRLLLHNQNRLISITPPQGSDLTLSTNYFDTGYTGEPIQTSTHRVKEGWPIGNFYGLKSVGVDEAGKWVVEILDDDGNVEGYDYAEKANSSDWQVLGNGVPDAYANWNNNFRFKSFDLAITMRGAFGAQALNFQKLFYGNPTIAYNVLNSAFDGIDVVDMTTGKPTGKTAVISDAQRYVSYYIEDVDYWKIDNVTLGYNLRIKGGKILKALRVYGSVRNLATFTSYSGLDPEIRTVYGDDGAFDPGTDNRDKFPTIRSFTFGVNLTF